MTTKPILVLDFDGVLHGYQSGWQGAAICPDPPVPGALDFVCEAVEHFRVCVHSSRSGLPGGINAMRSWLTAQLYLSGRDLGAVDGVASMVEFPTEKPPALVTIDGRAITFDGTWPTMEDLKNFQPWNKKTTMVARDGIEAQRGLNDTWPGDVMVEESGTIPQKAWDRLGRSIDIDALVEKCAAVVDQCNRKGPYNAIGAAARIRELKSDPTTAVKKTYHDDVGDFHRRFELPHSGDGRPPELIKADVLAFRVKFMTEELLEFEGAHAEGNIADAADALADLVYVALGTAHLMGVPFDDVWREVQRANMTKVRALGADDPRSKRSHALDVVKPADFRPPDHRPALERAARDARRVPRG